MSAQLHQPPLDPPTDRRGDAEAREAERLREDADWCREQLAERILDRDGDDNRAASLILALLDALPAIQHASALASESLHRDEVAALVAMHRHARGWQSDLDGIVDAEATMTIDDAICAAEEARADARDWS